MPLRAVRVSTSVCPWPVPAFLCSRSVSPTGRTPFGVLPMVSQVPLLYAEQLGTRAPRGRRPRTAVPWESWSNRVSRLPLLSRELALGGMRPGQPAGCDMWSLSPRLTWGWGLKRSLGALAASSQVAWGTPAGGRPCVWGAVSAGQVRRRSGQLGASLLGGGRHALGGRARCPFILHCLKTSVLDNSYLQKTSCKSRAKNSHVPSQRPRCDRRLLGALLRTAVRQRPFPGADAPPLSLPQGRIFALWPLR